MRSKAEEWRGGWNKNQRALDAVFSLKLTCKSLNVSEPQFPPYKTGPSKFTL